MKKIIRMLISLLVVTAMTCGLSICAYAAGTVTYSVDSSKFIFEPGSSHSPTDLFTEYKGLMPGDSVRQDITVKNDSSYGVKVKLYVRSHGAHEDSVDFLSKLHLTVAKSENNEMAYMFDAAASETAQLDSWVCLGTLYSGGKVNLDVTLKVPAFLDNEFQNNIGYLDWEFMVNELPIEPDDPKVPQTGDDSNIGLWLALLIASVLILIILICRKKHKDKD